MARYVKDPQAVTKGANDHLHRRRGPSMNTTSVLHTYESSTHYAVADQFDHVKEPLTLAFNTALANAIAENKHKLEQHGADSALAMQSPYREQTRTQVASEFAAELTHWLIEKLHQ
jgi:hypothetical protein